MPTQTTLVPELLVPASASPPCECGQRAAEPHRDREAATSVPESEAIFGSSASVPRMARRARAASRALYWAMCSYELARRGAASMKPPA